MTKTIEKTVREIAAECPASVRVFENLGIDYCCGGKRSLRDVCSSANLSFERVSQLLEQASQTPAAEADVKWSSAALAALTRHIVDKHHSYVRQEIPRLEALLDKVAAKHAGAHPELTAIRQQFDLLAQELMPHLFKEEQILFPYIEQMEAARLAGSALPPAFFGTVERPIANMAADHDGAGDLLRALRGLSNGYSVPAGACPTYGALYRGLAEFEADLHQHIHLENNILFPRAIEMERAG